MASSFAETSWSPGLLELATALSLAPQAQVRRRIAELCAALPRPTEVQVKPELFRLAVMLVRAAARNMAGALGTTPVKLLQFSNPLCGEITLEGTRGIERRLDRALGGGPLVILEARQPLHVKWQGPGLGRFFVLSGAAWANERKAGPNEFLLAPVGATVLVAAGGNVLLRDSPVAATLALARNAGLEFDALAAEAASSRVTAATTMGILQMDEDHATLGRRHIHLSAAEAAVLRTLAEAGGAVVRRAELAAMARVKSEKSLEYVLVHLRDKLGDGLITTVYGSGCALEMS